MSAQLKPVTQLEYAQYYIERLGWGLCAIPKGTKAPRKSGWNKPALYIDTFDKAKSQIHGDNGMGMIHRPCQTCAIDVDHLEFCKIAFSEFGIDIEALLKSGLQISSGRENRAKAIFSIPNHMQGSQRHALMWPNPNEPHKTVAVLELRTGDCQDVLPPSIHPDTNKPYEWLNAPWDNDHKVPDLPEVLIQLFQNWDKLGPQLKDACPWEKKKHAKVAPPKVERQASSYSNNIIEEFNQAHNLGAMLEQYGYARRGNRYLSPSSGTGLAGIILFDDEQHFFCHHASDVFGDNKRHDAFDLFCMNECNNDMSTAVATAANLLGINSQPQETVKVDISRLLNQTTKHKKTTTLSNPIPDTLLNPPGFLKTISEEIIESARMPQPVFAVTATLSLMATMLARKVETETELQTNLYLIALGPTGCGKEHARKYIKNMLYGLDLKGQIGGEDIASGPGLMNRATLNPDALFQIDEFGDFLQSATDKNSASHKAAVLTGFMKLFSATGTIMPGAEYAGHRDVERPNIEYPCINLHATGTDAIFYDALKGRHILDGYLNRMIVTKTDIDIPIRKRAKAKKEPSKSLIDWYQAFHKWQQKAGGNLQGINPASPITVLMTDEAWDLFDELQLRIDDKIKANRESGLDSLYVRLWENAAKVSLVCGCAKAKPLITKEDANWAIQFVEYWTNELVEEAKLRIADTDFGAYMNLVLANIRKYPDGITHGRLFNHKKLREIPPATKQHIIMALSEIGEIKSVQEKPEKGGRTAPVYYPE